ncbi:MAG: FlgD immunoglobulin-like domain containing protein, partial [Gemmatimonadales bacterium]|nr:FlgD immunoglobulin-like domain containing protein [Gemmatimonadales bacterium]
TASNIATVRIEVDIITATRETPWVPGRFALHQNVPNPFNPTTSITFDVPAGGARVNLDVYDVRGRLVARLVDGRQSPGRKQVTWDGTDRRGQHVSSGVYFYMLQAPSFRQTRKMVLIQ